MELTDREIQIRNEIGEWEEKLYQYEPTDFSILYEKWLEDAFSLLPETARNQFFSQLDTWLFHLHAIVQSSQIQQDAKERILGAARVFDENIETVSDLKELKIDHLNYIAEQQVAKHRLYSFAQGGISGTGGVLLLGSDIPAMTLINVRTVQLIAMAYGYEANTPFEMMLALKVFRGGTMPKKFQADAWEELRGEIENIEDDYFYTGHEELINSAWMEQPLKQVLKGAAIMLFRKKLFQGIPLLSMGIGAAANYQMTRQVSEYALKFYQYRYLKEKQDDRR
ncbi:EcsC family protein [Bacillus massiliglaciei]|uniref:EcsC family protein n=1 Tax=Bacillus massiliglaciei TaxID=1816693 RepID=UPI000B04CE53|nr:EcsC family protein [Bacillus massiliglaciei]